MDSKSGVKKELAELINSYNQVSSLVEELRDDGALNPHDCDNILGHLKSGMIEDVLLYARSNVTQDLERNSVKAAEDYIKVKKALAAQKLSPEEVKEVIGLFFKK